ncbi:hypothetical protein GCM10023331_31330 [Algivirga pacifica]|uniref:DUF4412 domain-containing protein n=2 Tax=Algivirga pacifica TaxID=1162670 RepID=A0ABP9DJ63_9BACT
MKEALDKADQKTDEETYKMWEKMASRGGSAEEIKEAVRGSYNFDYQIHYVMATKKKNGKEDQTEVIFYTNTENDYLGVKPIIEDEDMEVISVFDRSEKVMVNFTEDKKKGNRQAIAMKLDLDEIQAQAYEDEAAEDANQEEAPKFKKTGETKEINGISCEKYVGEGEDHEIELWLGEVDQAAPFMPGSFQGQSKRLAEVMGDIPVNKNLIMMEMQAVDKRNGEVSSMKVKELGDADMSVKSEDYELMAIPQGYGNPTPDEE